MNFVKEYVYKIKLIMNDSHCIYQPILILNMVLMMIMHIRQW